MNRPICLLLVLTISGAVLQLAGQRPGPSRVTSSSEQVQSLAVRIETGDTHGAGTDNTVYFDIGPLAWKLDLPHHNDFERGRSDTYELISKSVNLQTKQTVNLKRSDILWLRLHKKGIAGVTGTGDGFAGAWHPRSLTVIVNGVPQAPMVIDEPLNSKCWFWRDPDPDDFDLDVFAHSLRMCPNRGLNWLDKISGFVTTFAFKERGISGWLRNPRMKECSDKPPRHESASILPPLCVSGEIFATGRSSDGLETIDVKVSRIEDVSCPSTMKPSSISFDAAHDLTEPRFIRVENGFAHNRVKRGQLARICGNVWWDTDREGWWEIHPRSSKDLRPKN